MGEAVAVVHKITEHAVELRNADSSIMWTINLLPHNVLAQEPKTPAIVPFADLATLRKAVGDVNNWTIAKNNTACGKLTLPIGYTQQTFTLKFRVDSTEVLNAHARDTTAYRVRALELQNADLQATYQSWRQSSSFSLEGCDCMKWVNPHARGTPEHIQFENNRLQEKINILRNDALRRAWDD